MFNLSMNSEKLSLIANPSLRIPIVFTIPQYLNFYKIIVKYYYILSTIL